MRDQWDSGIIRMITVDCRSDENWLEKTLEGVRMMGCAIVRNVVPPLLIQVLQGVIPKVQTAYHLAVDRARLERAGEIGVIRAPMLFSPEFYRLLELPEVLQVVDRAVSETGILHVQNVLALPPASDNQGRPSVFQYRFHQDFPRVLNGCMMSINTFFAISDFSRENGATLVVPGTHQKSIPPTPEYLHANAVSVECPAGSMLVFDSTLWHAAGDNQTNRNRLAINNQFTRSYIKQQIDYCRALGEAAITPLKPRTQQLLGYYVRTPASLDEYYQPEEKRLYQRGQG
jgi:ectoine hydroxylase-related dioxygenase (phytanoyl-CoA dioxygenase family)